MEFKKYGRTNVAEMAQYEEGMMLASSVSISEEDKKAGSPKEGDMIARNPMNHNDQWLVARDYFNQNFGEVKTDFGFAIKALKRGQKVARKGWNGNGMFAYYVKANVYPTQSGVAIETFPEGMVPYRAYIALKTAQGDVATWSPSCSDALAEDWMVVE